ncbi:MAG: TonB-dependent siderophore receptor [Burkholderiaceae bacterium]
MARHRHPSRIARSACRTAHPHSSFPPERSAAVRMALLLGLTVGTVLAHAPPARAQTAGEAVGEREDARATQTTQTAQTTQTTRTEPPTPARDADGGTDARATLPAVTVHGESVSATAPYAGGQVASGGRVGLLGEKDFMETPFSTVSYTDKFIADRQAKDITEVIAATDPTVFSNGVSGAWSENYSIRGFASGISDTTIGGLYGMAPYYRTTPEMFERIEVLKGPSALLNGMPPGGSVGGTVNLVPKRAGDAPLTRLTATYLSDSQFGGHLDLGRRFGVDKQFGIRLNVVYRDGEGPVDRQEKKAQLVSLGLDWRGTRARASVDLYTSEDRVHGVTRGINLAPGVAVPRPPKPETLLNPDWSFVRNKDRGAIVRGEFDLSDRLTAYAAFGASKTEYLYNGAMSAQVLDAAGNYRTSMGQLSFDIDKTSGEVGLRGRFETGSVRHRWALNATRYADTERDYGRRSVPGADWTTNLYNPVWGPAADFSWPPTLHTETRLTSYGLADTLSFAQDTVQLTLGVRRQQVVTDTFSLTTGERSARYDAGATSPAAALLFRATEHLSLYGNYIEGLSKGQTAPATAANAGELFPPYKTKQKEIGLKLDLGEFAHTFSLYEITRPGSYTDPVTNVFSFGGEQRNRGIEWGVFGSPLRGVRLMGGIAYVSPKMTRTAGGTNQGRQATGVPKLQGKLGVEWDAPAVPGLTLTANATAVSKQYISADNSLWAPGRTIFDVGARYATRVSGRPLTLRAGIANLTNKAYWGMPLLSSLALGAPRTFALSATMDF